MPNMKHTHQMIFNQKIQFVFHVIRYTYYVSYWYKWFGVEKRSENKAMLTRCMGLVTIAGWNKEMFTVNRLIASFRLDLFVAVKLQQQSVKLDVSHSTLHTKKTHTHTDTEQQTTRFTSVTWEICSFRSSELDTVLYHVDGNISRVYIYGLIFIFSTVSQSVVYLQTLFRFHDSRTFGALLSCLCCVCCYFYFLL